LAFYIFNAKAQRHKGSDPFLYAFASLRSVLFRRANLRACLKILLVLTDGG